MLLHPEDAIDATALEQFRLPRSSGETVPGVAKPTMEATNGDELTRIRQALMRTGGNVVRAAQLLGLWRDALRYRMRRHGIRPLTLADLMQAPVSQPIDPLIVNARAPSGWEQKPVEVLAIDLTWRDASAVESLPYEPWTVTARWEQMIVEKVEGFGGGACYRMPPPCCCLLLAFPKRWSSRPSGRCTRLWRCRSWQATRVPWPRRGHAPRCGWDSIGGRCWWPSRLVTRRCMCWPWGHTGYASAFVRSGGPRGGAGLSADGTWSKAGEHFSHGQASSVRGAMNTSASLPSCAHNRGWNDWPRRLPVEGFGLSAARGKWRC